MKIAVCSLSQFTYVAEFIDAAQKLGEKHEVCYFLGFYCQNSISLIQEKGLSYQVLLDEQIDIRNALVDPALTTSPHEIFEGYFFKHAELLLPSLLKALKTWKPDLILSQYRDYSGMTGAEILNIPMVSFGTAGSPFRIEGVDPPYGAGIEVDAPDRVMQLCWKMNNQFNQKLDWLYNHRIRRPYQLSDISGVSTLHSNKLVLLSTIPSLSNKSSPDPHYLNFVGPLFLSRPTSESTEEADTIAFIASSPKPRIFVSLGTIHIELTKRCLKALEDFDGTIVVSLGGKKGIDLDSFFYRRNIIYRTFFYDFYAVLRLVDAVVTTASGKVMMESLSVGKPLICLPCQGEHYENAVRLRSLGAAEAPCLKRWDEQRFFEIVKQVINRESYKKAAEVLQSEIHLGVGVDKAVKAIECLL